MTVERGTANTKAHWELRTLTLGSIGYIWHLMCLVLQYKAFLNVIIIFVGSCTHLCYIITWHFYKHHSDSFVHSAWELRAASSFCFFLPDNTEKQSMEKCRSVPRITLSLPHFNVSAQRVSLACLLIMWPLTGSNTISTLYDHNYGC